MRALCHSDEIAEGQSKGFDLEDGTSLFVVRMDARPVFRQ